jgi:hypothetical protein
MQQQAHLCSRTLDSLENLCSWLQDLLVSSIRLWGPNLQDPGVTEGMLSEPNPGLGGRSVGIVTGATLGGSSAINGAQWTEPAIEVRQPLVDSIQ